MNPKPSDSTVVECGAWIAPWKRSVCSRRVTRRRRIPVDRERHAGQIRRHDYEEPFAACRADAPVREPQRLYAAPHTNATGRLEGRIHGHHANDRRIGRPCTQDDDRVSSQGHDVRPLRRTLHDSQRRVGHPASSANVCDPCAAQHGSDSERVDDHRCGCRVAPLRVTRGARGSRAGPGIRLAPTRGVALATCGYEREQPEREPRAEPHATAAQHSISTRAPSANPFAPRALRAGLFFGK